MSEFIVYSGFTFENIHYGSPTILELLGELIHLDLIQFVSLHNILSHASSSSRTGTSIQTDGNI